MSILNYILYAVGGAVTLVYLIKLYFKLVAGVCKSKRRLDGAVAIVTGSNTGIGFETAKDLARRGAKVYLACRDTVKAEHASDEIKRETNSKKVIVKKLDLSSMVSVRSFCKEFMSEENRLDILVNNAGVAGLRKTINDEGFELQFATNHFGPFLLTNILLGSMIKTGKGRIVNVSSLAHNWTKELDLENLNSEKKWEPKLLYARAKLCNILFARELNKRLADSGHSNINANAVNPGGVKTEIFRHARKWFKYMIMVSQFFFKTPAEGAQPIIHLCVSEEIDGVGGLYWTDCKKDNTSKLGANMELAKDLWDVTAKHVKLTPNEYHLK